MFRCGRDLRHGQCLAGTDIVSAERKFVGRQSGNLRLHHIVDIDVVIEEFGIARDFGRLACGGIADQRGEVAISAPVGSVDAANAQVLPSTKGVL